mgnify:CR=1 FL=1
MNEAKKNMTESVKYVAEELHNTPAVAKKEYINTDIIEYYLDDNWSKVHKLLNQLKDNDDVFLELLRRV